MEILDSIFGKVKSDLSYRAGSGISDGITNAVKKGMGAGEKVPECPKCKAKIADTSLKFCPQCGNKLRPSCDKCNQDFAFGTKFCPNCGNVLK